MIERVVDHRDQGQRRQRRQADVAKQHREARAGEQQAHVLDRGVRQQSFQLALHRGE